MNKIIFFINCYVNKKYDSLLNIYLDDFQKSGIQDRKDVRLIFVVVGTPEDYVKVEGCVREKLPKIYNDYGGKNKLTTYQSNRIEFRVYENSSYEHIGLETAWKEGQTSKDDELITYTHCRGLSHQRPHHPEMKGSREVHSYLCGKCIIQDYNKVEEIFKDQQIQKVGMGQSAGGWMWFNFWTVKASYLKKKDAPSEQAKLTPEMKKYFDRFAKDRHYYEAWLGDDGMENESGHSLLVTPHKGTVITGPQMLSVVNHIVAAHYKSK